MNILYHHRTQGTGAEGVHIAYVIKGFRQLGHSVQVVSPGNEDPSTTAGGNPYARKRGGLKKLLLASLSRLLPQPCFELMEMAYNFTAAPKLRKATEGRGVDVIYERYAFFMTAGAQLARRNQIPYLVEVNETAGHKRVRKQFFVGQARRSEKLIFGQADAVLVVSDFLKDEIAKLGVDRRKIHVIPNGADAELFDPTRLRPGNLRQTHGIPKDAVVFGFIGWFVGWHNLDWFIEQFACLKGRHAVLVLFGDGPLRERLSAAAEENGLEKQVIFPGAIPYEEVPACIDIIDVGVIPGSNEYRSPIKLFEYMIMGKPVIAPRFQPIESIVSDLTDGMLFDPADADGLRRQLVRLASDEGLRQVMGENARQKILKEHLWQHNAAKILNICAEARAVRR